MVFAHVDNSHNLVIFWTNSPSDSPVPKDDAADTTMLFSRVDMYGCCISITRKKNVMRSGS